MTNQDTIDHPVFLFIWSIAALALSSIFFYAVWFNYGLWLRLNYVGKYDDPFFRLRDSFYKSNFGKWFSRFLITLVALPFFGVSISILIGLAFKIVGR